MTPGTVAYLTPYWVEIVSVSPKSQRVRYRKLARTPTPIERMGAKALQLRARVA